MSIPSVVPVFESGIGPLPPSPLQPIIDRHLENAAKENHARETAGNPEMDGGNTLTLPQQVGDYLTQWPRVWFEMTETLVFGDHMEKYMTDLLESQSRFTKLADMPLLHKEDARLVKLRKIGEKTEIFSREVLEIWNQSGDVKPSSQPLPKPSGELKLEDIPVMSQPQSSASLGHESPPGTDTGDSEEDEDEQFANIDMKALKTRGKGNYTCPLKHRCDKGGVDKDGNLVVFDRNSSFAQHCNKHRKPWRCDIPGCPNPLKKRKFARRDGLERHKATVKHRVMS